MRCLKLDMPAAIVFFFVNVVADLNAIHGIAAAVGNIRFVVTMPRVACGS